MSLLLVLLRTHRQAVVAAVVIVSSVCVGPLRLDSQVLNDEKGKYVHIVAMLVHLIRDIS